jgi:LacI family transcriptional regulator
MKKKITQKELASQLGISQTLVSMVLNGRQNGISPKSIKLIWDKAVEAGYTPRGMDVSHTLSDIVNRKSIEIGIISRSGVNLNSTSNFFSHVYQGVHSEALKNKLFTVYIGSEDDFKEDEMVEVISQKNLFGLVILGEIKTSLLLKLKMIGLNLIATSAEFPGICDSVISNEEESTELLVNHLYSLGHRKFGWLGGNMGQGRHKDRFNALIMSLRKRELLLSEKNCIDMNAADRIEGRKAIESLIQNLGIENLPTSIICYNGLMARAALNYLLQNQISVPERISIAAIDMTRICYEEYPGITSASAYPEIFGAKALQRLLEAAKNPDTSSIPKRFTLESNLEVRNTTGAVNT